MGAGSLFTDPMQAVMQAKASRSTGLSVALLLLSGIFLAIGMGVDAGVSTRDAVYATIMAAMAFVGVFIYGLILSALVGSAMKSLGGSGGFFEGVTTVAYTSFLPSLAAMIAITIPALVSLADNTMAIRAAGFAIVPIIMWGTVLGLAALFSSMRGLFQVDSVTALSGAIIVLIGGGIVVFALQRALLGFILSSMW